MGGLTIFILRKKSLVWAAAGGIMERGGNGSLTIWSVIMTHQERQTRANVRNFLCCATPGELNKEWLLSIERRDYFRATCIKELMDEAFASKEKTTVRYGN